MSLIQIDPYKSVYDFKSVSEPGFEPGYIALPKWKVNAVNELVRLSHGRDEVKTEEDWNVVANIVVFFIQTFPDEWKQFRESISDIRETRRSGGYSRTKEMRYVASIPIRLERLIKLCFPQNQVNKDFIYNFIKRFKIFKVGGENN